MFMYSEYAEELLWCSMFISNNEFDVGLPSSQIFWDEVFYADALYFAHMRVSYKLTPPVYEFSTECPF